MTIKTRVRDGVTILDLGGKLTIGTGDVQLRGAVGDALGDGATKFVLNMAGVTSMDSSGVGELVSAHVAASGRGAALKLASIPPKVIDILTITQLITIFDVYDDEDEAIASF